uniref:Uncharacterized protein n=1 Tax=Cacopsylla melanoneura TaxID=428564 RepID=A0A8D9E4J2_9HEMI
MGAFIESRLVRLRFLLEREVVDFTGKSDFLVVRLVLELFLEYLSVGLLSDGFDVLHGVVVLAAVEVLLAVVLLPVVVIVLQVVVEGLEIILMCLGFLHVVVVEDFLELSSLSHFSVDAELLEENRISNVGEKNFLTKLLSLVRSRCGCANLCSSDPSSFAFTDISFGFP